ncbi:MAG: hypothetical protein KJ060_02595 [Candidatus Hydrogenedentes bacterium]|nr:hypothetical protein [Candidatus Hydrogenedentota bacterium]
MTPESNHDIEPLLNGEELPADAWDRPPIDPRFREAVFAQTASALRARSLRRHVVTAGALVAASYAGGMVTAWIALQPEPAPAPAESMTVAPPAAVDNAAPIEPVVTDDLLRDPEGLSLLVAQSPAEEQEQILKAAGDRYLEGFGDIEQAMNCYRRLLALQQPGAGVAMNLDDSWLLKSMKQARLQEELNDDATT